MVLQLTPSVRPAWPQVLLEDSVPVTVPPAKLSYFEAMLLAGAAFWKAEVSYQPKPVVVELLGEDS